VLAPPVLDPSSSSRLAEVFPSAENSAAHVVMVATRSAKISSASADDLWAESGVTGFAVAVVVGREGEE
jgi:hypothetical protein